MTDKDRKRRKELHKENFEKMNTEREGPADRFDGLSRYLCRSCKGTFWSMQQPEYCAHCGKVDNDDTDRLFKPEQSRVNHD